MDRNNAQKSRNILHLDKQSSHVYLTEYPLIMAESKPTFKAFISHSTRKTLATVSPVHKKRVGAHHGTTNPRTAMPRSPLSVSPLHLARQQSQAGLESPKPLFNFRQSTKDVSDEENQRIYESLYSFKKIQDMIPVRRILPLGQQQQ